MPKKSVDKQKDNIKNVNDNLYMSADYIMNLERTLIPLTPAFDEVLGGGLVSGSLTSIYGPPKSGKSTTCLQWAAQCQKPEYGGRYWSKKAAEKRGDKPGRPTFFYFVENRLTKRDLSGIPGLNLSLDKFKVIGTTDEQTLYLEDYFANIEETINLFPGCILIIDSIGGLCSKKVAAAVDGDQVRDPSALLTSFFLKRIAPLIMAKDIIMLCVLHKVTNTGAKPGQSQTTVTGGKKIKYAANNLIDAKWSEIDKNDENSYILHLEGETSELGRPDVTAEAYLRFNRGFYREYELILLVTAQDTNGLHGVHKSSAWYQFDSTLTGDKPYKAQGIINAAQWLEQHPEAYRTLYNNYASAYWPNTGLYER